MRLLSLCFVLSGVAIACSSSSEATPDEQAGEQTASSSGSSGASSSGGSSGASSSSSSSSGDAGPTTPPMKTPIEECGGKPCDAGKRCLADSDCASDACRENVCAIRKSCKAKFGGGTCGSGEIGAAGAKHEDCCTVIDVPRPEKDGGAYKLDKYLITAGRMRQFIEAVKGDVKSYVAKETPKEWDATWTKAVPGGKDEIVGHLGPGIEGVTTYPNGQVGPGCYVKGLGAPAYWFDKADQASVGDVEREFTQNELDSKVLNCATRALFSAFCHWDGGRLPTIAEWKYAATGGDPKHTYPWGTDADIAKYASYGPDNYSWPREADVDRGGILPAPGRFPQGAGPFGHQDLAGAVENFLAGPEMGVMQYSFQERGKEEFKIPYGRTRPTWVPSTKHWAIGARCARD